MKNYLKIINDRKKIIISIQSQVINDLKVKAGDDILLDVKDCKIIIQKKM